MSSKPKLVSPELKARVHNIESYAAKSFATLNAATINTDAAVNARYPQIAPDENNRLLQASKTLDNRQDYDGSKFQTEIPDGQDARVQAAELQRAIQVQRAQIEVAAVTQIENANMNMPG